MVGWTRAFSATALVIKHAFQRERRVRLLGDVSHLLIHDDRNILREPERLLVHRHPFVRRRQLDVSARRIGRRVGSRVLVGLRRYSMTSTPRQNPM